MQPPHRAAIGFVIVVGMLLAFNAEVASQVSRAQPKLPPSWLRWVEEGRGGPPSPPFPTAPSIQAMMPVGSDTIFAGSFGMGIFRSHDRGRSWESANEGLTDRFILSFAAGPDGTLYAGTVRAGVFRSVDGGKNWQTINKGLKRLQIKALLIRNRTVYAGTGSGVYRYSKRQAQWRSVADGLEDTLVHAIVIGADGTVYAGTSGKGIMQRKAKARDWTRLSQGLVDHEGLPENFIRVMAIGQDQAVYAGTFDGGVFRSTDAGGSWKPISRALPNDSIRGIVSDNGRLYVATGRGIFKTLNSGREWIPINDGLTEMSVQSLVRSAGGSLYAGTSGGAFRSDDDGRTWMPINTGLEGATVPPFRMFE